MELTKYPCSKQYNDIRLSAYTYDIDEMLAKIRAIPVEDFLNSTEEERQKILHDIHPMLALVQPKSNEELYSLLPNLVQGLNGISFDNHRKEVDQYEPEKRLDYYKKEVFLIEKAEKLLPLIGKFSIPRIFGNFETTNPTEINFFKNVKEYYLFEISDLERNVIVHTRNNERNRKKIALMMRFGLIDFLVTKYQEKKGNTQTGIADLISEFTGIPSEVIRTCLVGIAFNKANPKRPYHKNNPLTNSKNSDYVDEFIKAGKYKV